MKIKLFLNTLIITCFVSTGCNQNGSDEPIIPPDPPTGVTATVEVNAIKISWNEVAGVESYSVHRSYDGNFYREYDNNKGDCIWWNLYDNSFLDDKPIVGINYYMIQTQKWIYDSENSEIVSCIYIPAGGSTETGLHLGIIGFNENIYPREISFLTHNNKSQFQSFVDDLAMKPATGLYYAVDNAINMLQGAILPNDLVNISIVTFTDGLDNVSIDLNTNHKSRDAYRDALQGRIKNTKVKGLNINAYSVGIKGGDVVDIDAFRAGLVALASNTNNANEVTSMTEVNNTFRNIANSLYDESQSQSIKLRITGGYDDGTKIRFTFDNVADAANSNYYIEGTYRRDGTTRSLQNVVYQGLTSNGETTITGEVSGVYVTFTFEKTSTALGGNVVTTNVQQWEYIPSQTRWQRNSEFNQTGDIETIIERKSAVIILVLDCTSSLDASGANGFRDMKNAANNFINELAK